MVYRKLFDLSERNVNVFEEDNEMLHETAVCVGFRLRTFQFYRWNNVVNLENRYWTIYSGTPVVLM